MFDDPKVWVRVAEVGRGTAGPAPQPDTVGYNQLSADTLSLMLLYTASAGRVAMCMKLFHRTDYGVMDLACPPIAPHIYIIREK